ncbi:unnamed protein product [Rotaria socialis]|uniref:C-type lectin domain-containing protein n=3 Tax=Rotaria socialis TaxID=392032 RepID=A0A817UFC3_9BILA|nr:unnamed protein product [Rotaria socialis]CAF3384827.1 unnamed protein product [Rotaria socialis]CAF3419693.1 unnamed protein product [Rotaria socialis]CAF3734902.1 unnamed protein product [Rotaria socialis]CAF4418166.1 unnamed protein product [Rotaria socialis]
MIPYYSFSNFHAVCLFLVISIVWCFNEHCTDDSSCSTSGLKCRLNHCLCPSDAFWAGYTKNCIPCPTGWINLYIFCIYHKTAITHWLDAVSECREMNSTSQLLEINNLNEFYFIQKSIKNILPDNQMKIEVNNNKKELFSSATAFIGSVGRGSSTDKWAYQFGNNSGNSYTSTSPMWCKEKQWGSIIIPAEPSFEHDDGLNITFQALKRWNDSTDACLVSLLETSKQSFLCEIVGDPARFYDQTILSFLFATIKRTLITTTIKKNLITDNQSFVTSQQLSTSALNNTAPSKLNITTGATALNRKQLLFIIIVIAGIFMVIIVIIIVSNMKFKKKDSSKSLKSNKRKSVSRSNSDKKTGEDLQSNSSSVDSPLSNEATTIKKPMQLQRISTDKQYSPSNSSRSINTDKVALWDVMESSLVSSTSHEATKHSSPYKIIQR